MSPKHHEHVTTAVDKEIQQHHYHTSVQPVHDREVMPEAHKHNLVNVEHRNFEHGDPKDVQARVAAEAGKFKDERHVQATQHSHSVKPVVAGEHIHHHVHVGTRPYNCSLLRCLSLIPGNDPAGSPERQAFSLTTTFEEYTSPTHQSVSKFRTHACKVLTSLLEVIQPSVVHTTVPIHEVHHNAAQHHTTSALPAVSMTDFKKQGGVLGGREERSDSFEGEPRSVGGALGGAHGAEKYQTPTHPRLQDRVDPRKDADLDGKRGVFD